MGGLHVRGVTKAFGETIALDDVSLVLDPGEIVAVLGHNGAGKTTLISAIVGLLQPDRGTIDVARPTDRAAPVPIAWAAQNIALYERLSVHDNVRTFAVLGGDTRVDERIAQAFTEFDLEELRQAPCVTLSGGQRRRVHVACAFVCDSPVTVLDEPTVGTDAASRSLILAAIRRRREVGASVLMTTHDVRDVEELSCSVVLLDRGRIVLASHVDTLLRQGAADSLLVRLDVGAEELAQVVSGRTTGNWVVVPAGDIAQTMQDILRFAETSGARILEVETHRRGLDLALIAETGSSFTAESQSQ